MLDDICRLLAAGAVVVAVMAVSVGVKADYDAQAFERGSRLYQECAEPTNRLYCLGYVGGVSDAMTAMSAGQSIGPIGVHTLCIPRDVGEGGELDVVMQFLTRHPELRHYNASPLVARALAEAFPCR